MKIKKLFIFFVISFSLINFSSCSNSNRPKEVNDILHNFGLATEYDVTYTTRTVSTYTAKQIIAKMVDNDQRFIVNNFTRESGKYSHSSTYLYKNSIYTYQSSQSNYQIHEYNEAEILELTEPLFPVNFDFETMNCTIKYSENAETMKYTIVIRDDSLRTIAEEALGEMLPNFTINGTMDIIADIETKVLMSLSIDISLQIGAGSPNTFNVTFTVNNVNEATILEMPLSITQQLDDYIAHKPIYIDTTDNVIKYHNIGSFSDFLYDKKSNSFIALRDNRLDVFDATTMQIIQSFSDFPAAVRQIDVDNGKLVVGYGMKEFIIIDLILNTNPQTIIVYDYVHCIKIDEEIVIYYNSTSSSDLGFYDISLNVIWYYKNQTNGTALKVDINHEEHIVYIGEQLHDWRENIIAVDIKSGNKIWIKTFPHEAYINDTLLYDGKYIHYQEKTFRSNDGVLVSNNLLNHSYTEKSGFIPFNTLYDSTNFSIVGHIVTNGRIGIYDYKSESFVYQFSIDYDDVIKLNESYFAVTNQTEGVLAIVNISSIDESLIESEETPMVGITISKDGHVKSLPTTRFLYQAVDEDYAYIINRENGNLEIYNIDTLALVHTETFTNTPNAVSVDNHKIAVSFLDYNEIVIFDNTTWEKQTVVLTKPARAVIVYDGKVYFTEKTNYIAIGNNQQFDLKVFEISSGVTSTLIVNAYKVQIEINRLDHLLYIKTTSYMRIFDLLTNNLSDFIFVGGSVEAPFFDGNFLHLDPDIFDKITGEKILTNTIPRDYANTEDWQVVKMQYDDNNLSIFTASSQQPFTMVVYDVGTNTHLYTYYGRITRVYKSGNKFILFDGSTGVISVLTLE